MREPEDVRDEELCRAHKLAQVCPSGHGFGVSQEPGAAGTGEGAVPGGADPACGRGQLEVR